VRVAGPARVAGFVDLVLVRMTMVHARIVSA
jgi:hypothetical protein